jgi:hypothetical protein
MKARHAKELTLFPGQAENVHQKIIGIPRLSHVDRRSDLYLGFRLKTKQSRTRFAILGSATFLIWQGISYAGSAVTRDLGPKSDLTHDDGFGTRRESSTTEDMPAKQKRLGLRRRLFSARGAGSDVGCGLG